jgi:hypothetical protein
MPEFGNCIGYVFRTDSGITRQPPIRAHIGPTPRRSLHVIDDDIVIATATVVQYTQIAVGRHMWIRHKTLIIRIR